MAKKFNPADYLPKEAPKLNEEDYEVEECVIYDDDEEVFCTNKKFLPAKDLLEYLQTKAKKDKSLRIYVHDDDYDDPQLLNVTEVVFVPGHNGFILRVDKYNPHEGLAHYS